MPVPTNPKAWKTLYTKGYIARLPKLSRQGPYDWQTHVTRDVLLEGSLLAKPAADYTLTFSDVLSFEEPTQQILLAKEGLLQITTRVLSSFSPLTVDLVPQSNDQTIFTLFASSVEQPIRIRVLAGESDSTVLGEFLLELGAAASRSCGVQVVVSGGTVDVSYLDTYDQVDNALCRDEVLRSIKTQLRLSDILFWTAPDIAQGISQHIMRMTVNSTFAADMHMQAASIAQQLLLNNYTGPDTTYAPVLKLETYQKTLESAIDLAMAYEHQQERFEDRKASAEDQKASLGAILGHARDVAARQSVRCDQSGAKLRAADIDLRKEQYNFESERRLLREKQVYFELGLKEWVRHEAVKAVFQLATAILEMAVAIGAAVIAPPAAPAAAGAGVGAVLSTVNKFIEMAGTAKDSQKMSDTFKAVCEAIQKTQSFVESTFKMVSAMEAIRAQQDSASDASGPSKETLSSFYSANMESQTLVTLASWDAWNEESDAAMASIENSNIAGASEYRVQLKKHAIHAKLVAQLQAQYAKAGQEHVQQLATAGVAAADVRRLEQLDSSFAGEIDAARDAAEICYDSVMTVRLNITVEMRNATWAYRFLSLRKSKVIMDPTKSIVFLKADALAIAREVEQWQEDFSSDAATYMPTPVRLSRLLGPSFKDQIASLITSGVASFTLMPVALGAPDSSSNPGPFTRGSNFRVEGMRAFLVGAKVKNDQDEVRLEIATAGLYADRDTQGVAHYFQSMPMSRTFCYRSVDSSAAVFPDSSIAIDSFIAGKSHVDFTPFTNWKIKVMEPGNLDLDGLEDVVIVWRGTAQFQ